MPIGAIVGGSIVSGLLGSQATSDAASQTAAATNYAAQLQAEAERQALAQQAQQFNIGQQNLAPYLGAGRNALAYIQSLMLPGAYNLPAAAPGYVTVPNAATPPAPSTGGGGGLLGAVTNALGNLNIMGLTSGGLGGAFGTAPGTAPTNALGAIPVQGSLYPGAPETAAYAPYMGSFQASPDYAFRFQQGEKALQNKLGAAGMNLSGRALKAATDYGQQAASQEYGNWWNRNQQEKQNYLSRLYQLAGLGSGAVNTGINAGQNYASNVGNLMTGAANALGNIAQSGAATQAQLGMGGAANLNQSIQSGIGNYLGYMQNQQMMNLLGG